MKRTRLRLGAKLALRLALLLLVLFLFWLALDRPAFSAEQAVRWSAAEAGWEDDFQIYLLERVSQNNQGLPGPIYAALTRCGDQYYELVFKRIWLLFWQPYASDYPILPVEDATTPLVIRTPFWFRTFNGRWAAASREVSGVTWPDYQESRFFYANDPSIVRVTFTVGDTTREAVRPEADRPFWYLMEHFPYRASDPGFQYRGYDAEGTLVYDSGLCPFDGN